MNRLYISLIALLAVFAFSTPAFADHFCDINPEHEQCDDGGGEGGGGDGDGDNTNQQQQGQIGINAQAQGIFDSGNAEQDQAQGIFDSGNATQGQIGINKQDTDIGNGRGNFSPDADARIGSIENEQGQKQGQIGINKQSGENKQGQFGYIDDHSIYEAQERNPVSSAAPVSAAACASGVSAQGVDFGAAIAKTNPYCNLALTAEVARAAGQEDVALEMVGLMRQMALDDAEGIYGTRGFMRSLPVFGGLLSFIW